MLRCIFEGICCYTAIEYKGVETLSSSIISLINYSYLFVSSNLLYRSVYAYWIIWSYMTILLRFLCCCYSWTVFKDCCDLLTALIFLFNFWTYATCSYYSFNFYYSMEKLYLEEELGLKISFDVIILLLFYWDIGLALGLLLGILFI